MTRVLELIFRVTLRALAGLVVIGWTMFFLRSVIQPDIAVDALAAATVAVAVVVVAALAAGVALVVLGRGNREG